MEIKNTPEIRFRGFEDEWEFEELGKLVSRKKSYPISRASESKRITDLKYVHYGDIHVNKARLINKNSDIPYINGDGHFEYLNCGDIILADASEDYEGIGSPSVMVENLNVKTVAATHTIAFTPNYNDSLFLYYLFQTTRYKNFLKKKSTGIKVFGITFKNLSKFEIIYPRLKEQEKIGSLFKNLDERLAIEREKHEKLKEFKRSMLEKMFPKEGKTAPEIRFDGFNGEWCYKSVSEIFSIVESGNRLPKKMIEKGKIPYVIASVTNNGIADYISRDTVDYNGNNMKLFKVPSITFSIDNPDAIFVQESEFFTSNIMRVLYNDEYNVFHLKFIAETLKRLTRGYNWSIKFSGPVVMNSRIIVPVKINGSLDRDLMSKIGKIIYNLDEKIENSAQKIEKIEEFKKSLMDKMFV